MSEFQSRFIHSETVRAFLRTVRETSATRVTNVEMGQTYYRAQHGCGWRTVANTFYGGDATSRIRRQTAFSADRMCPKAEFVEDGRANPKGIPFLYVATTPTTAMAEVRPWLGSQVSLAHFKLFRDVVLVAVIGAPTRILFSFPGVQAATLRPTARNSASRPSQMCW
jgi:hypothetical protein